MTNSVQKKQLQLSKKQMLLLPPSSPFPPSSHHTQKNRYNDVITTRFLSLVPKKLNIRKSDTLTML